MSKRGDLPRSSSSRRNSALYKIELAKDAEKEYRRLCKTDRALFDRIRNALYFIATDPTQGKPLKFSLKGVWSYRVGMYRILYTIERQRLVVYVIDMGHRREIYRR